MKRYWTADFHLGHGNILRYANRPFRDVDHMDKRLIAAANERAREDDVLIHVGDFMCYGNEKGVAGKRNHPKFYIDQFKSRLVLLEGNHDKQNKVKTIGQQMFCTMGRYRVFVSHFPLQSDMQDLGLAAYAMDFCDFGIVGHVHDRWATRVYKRKNRKPYVDINVGVDVMRYRPVGDDEVIGKYEQTLRRLALGIIKEQ